MNNIKDVMKRLRYYDFFFALIAFGGALLATLSSGYLWNDMETHILIGQSMIIGASAIEIIIIFMRIRLEQKTRKDKYALSSRLRAGNLFLKWALFVVALVIAILGFNQLAFTNMGTWLLTLIIIVIPTALIPTVLFILKSLGIFTAMGTKATVRVIKDPKLDELTVPELKAYAKKVGVKVPTGTKKADLIKLIKNR